MGERAQVAVVTGGGSGVGRATCLALAQDGYVVVPVGRTAEHVEETARLVEADGGGALPVMADVTRLDEVTRLFETINDTYGGLDALVCCAAVMSSRPVAELTLDEWQATLATNLTAVFLCARQAVPLMSETGGAIIAIGSGAGKQGYANLSAYAASKFGLIGFMESLAQEVMDAGIKVSVINPGSIRTGFGGRGVPTREEAAASGKRYLEPQDVAEAVRFLLRQPARAWTQEMNLWPR